MILIYGIKKSGTTFLQRLLKSQKIFSPPAETKIKFFNEFLFLYILFKKKKI